MCRINACGEFGVGALLVFFLGFSPSLELEPAALDELEHARELTAIEPDAVNRADVDDDAALASEISTQHQIFANWTRNVDDRLVERVLSNDASRGSSSVSLPAREQLVKQPVVDQLSSALSAIVKRPRTSSEGEEGQAAVRATKALGLAHRLQPERRPAGDAERVVGVVSVKAGAAADSGELLAAAATSERVVTHSLAAMRTKGRGPSLAVPRAGSIRVDHRTPTRPFIDDRGKPEGAFSGEGNRCGRFSWGFLPRAPVRKPYPVA